MFQNKSGASRYQEREAVVDQAGRLSPQDFPHEPSSECGNALSEWGLFRHGLEGIFSLSTWVLLQYFQNQSVWLTLNDTSQKAARCQCFSLI